MLENRCIILYQEAFLQELNKNMKKIKNYKQFINEGLSEDYAIDIYLQLIRIIGIHEKHFYNDDKIVKDEEFKSKIAGYMNKLIEGKNFKTYVENQENEFINTETIINTILEYEKKYYNEDKISDTPSMFSVIMYLVEDTIEEQDALTTNDYITGFSEKDIKEYEDYEESEENDENFNKNEPSRYNHDNKTDKYLGRYDEWDLYISNDNNTLICRYGNEKDNYISSKRDAIFQHSKYVPKQLKEAERRAINLKYIEPLGDEEGFWSEPEMKIDNSKEKSKLLKSMIGKNKVVMCIRNKEKNGYEHTCITVGNTYIVIKELKDHGIEKYELEEDDDLLPDKKFPKSWFMDYDEDEPEE